MRFSLLILGEHPPRHLAGLVRQAEAAGCDTFWYADEKFYRDPFVGLTVAAQVSTRIRLGTCVTEPYARHPALLAMAVASLDEVAGGRGVLGIGAGGSGFPPMGIERRSPARAIPEAVTIIRGLLRGETVEFSGQVFSFTRGRLNFQARPDIPIYVAARGRAMLRAAGAVADGVIIAPYASARGLRFAIDRIAEGAAGAGRTLQEIDVVARVDVCIAADRAAARQAVRHAVALPMWISYPNLSYLDPLGLPPPPADLIAILARREYALIGQAAALVPEAYLDHLAVAGTLEDVVQQLDQIRRAGIAHITLRPVASPGGTVEEVVEALAHDVMPRFRLEAPEGRRR
jgi:5,10-methylenetetrahydromethanopterin reductase